MKKTYLLLSLFIIILSFNACNVQKLSPEFRGFENVKLKNISTTDTEVTANVVLYNPNKMKIVLLNTKVDVYANELKLSEIIHDQQSVLAKKAEIRIPVVIHFKLTDLVKKDNSIMDVIQSAVNAYKDKSVQFKFVGNAQFKVAGLPFNVPVNHVEKIGI